MPVRDSLRCVLCQLGGNSPKAGLRIRRRLLSLAAATAATGTLAGGFPRADAQTPNAVTLYVSLDEPYAKPILADLERRTGLKLRVIYDTEANKSRGLAQKILAERRRPRADVFWSSEVLQMVRLAEAGALDVYRPPAAEDIPQEYRDPTGRWNGFGARFRILVFNTKQLAARNERPSGDLKEFLKARWNRRFALSNPLFGTATTEAAALSQLAGAPAMKSFYAGLLANGARVVDGNSVAADLVARGVVAAALTDTDDAFIRIDRGAPLQVVYPSLAGRGSLLIPNTAGLVVGGPNPMGGRKLLDALVSPETELLLAALPSRQLPLHRSLRQRLPTAVAPLSRIPRAPVRLRELPRGLPEVERILRELFMR